MAERVIIKEVAARDGLQAQPKHLTVEQRMALVAALAETGVPELEIGSFVSPKAVPQMAGTDEIADSLPAVDLAFSALVPNMKGYELAVRADIRCHAIALAATEEMNQNNIRKSLEDTSPWAKKSSIGHWMTGWPSMLTSRSLSSVRTRAPYPRHWYLSMRTG